MKRQGIIISCLFCMQFCCTKTYIMKKQYILLTAGILFTGIINAQFTKGDRVLGAGLSIQHNAYESNASSFPYTSKTNNGNISIDLGFANRQNRLSGFYLSGGYGKSKNEYASQPSSNFNSESFGVGGGFFTRRYQPIGKNFFLFAEGRAGVDYGKQNNSSNSLVERKTLNVSAGLFPGISYKTGKHFLLDLRFGDFVNLGYNHITDKGVGNTKTEQTNFGFSSSLGLGYLSNMGIGIRWIMPGGKK